MDQNPTNVKSAPAVQPTPVVAQSAPAAPAAPGAPAAAASKPKGKSKVGLIIGIIVAVLAVVGVVLLILNMNGAIGFAKNAIYETKAFFIKDKDGKYILFGKENGNRLTEEKYDNAESFHNGMALVEKDDKYGIIRDDGKMMVDFETFENPIFEVGAGLYATSIDTGDGYIYRLINGEGKTITEAESPFLGSAFFGDDEVPLVAVLGEENEYDVYNAYGQRVWSFESASEPVFEIVAVYGSKTDEYKYYASVSYDKGFALYEANHLGEVAKIEEGVSTRFVINRAADDKHFLLTEYYSDYSEKDDSKKLYVVDGKIVDYTSSCSNKELTFSEGMIVCYKEGDNGGEYPLTDDGKLMKYPDGRRVGDERAYYIDRSHYYVENVDDDAVAIYVDGAPVKTYSDVYTSKIMTGEDDNHYYYIHTRKDNKHTTVVLKEDGTEVFKHSGDFYYTVSAITADRIILYDYGCSYSSCSPKRESGEYLFDFDGKKLYGPVYDLSYVNDNYFEYRTGYSYSSDTKTGLIDKDGKEVFSKENYTDFSSSDNDIILARKSAEDSYSYSYVVLDKDFNDLIEFKYSDADFYNDYFVVENDGSFKYYDINIKEIYAD